MKKTLYSNRKIYLALFVVCLAGLFFRLFGLAWDQGFYLHPDERFLAMTADSLQWPADFFNYLNPQTSPLNPYNKGVSFFVYGHFPLNLAKLWAGILEKDYYSLFYQAARPLTAFFDWSVIMALFFLGRNLFRKHSHFKQIALFSALSYSLMVFPLQQAHFFTVDAFTNAAFIWSLFFSTLKPKKIWPTAASGFFFGMGLASKITVIYTLPLIMFVVFIKSRKVWPLLLRVTVFFASAYFTLRLKDPYLFANNNLLIPQIDPRYLQNLKELSSLGKTTFFPPGVQWLNTNWTLPLKNIVLYGLGPALTLLTMIGIFFFWQKRQEFDRQNKLILVAIVFWGLAFFVFQSFQFAKTMRYYLFLYPLFALFAALALMQLKKPWRLMLILPALMWFLAFFNIYSLPHSRIRASNWLNTNLKTKSVIVNEYWDDALPINPDFDKQFEILQLDFYQSDSFEKWQKISKSLARADYLVLSSNRQWGAISRASELYPIGSKYYQLLLNGKLGFKKVRQFNSFPFLQIGSLKLEINDSGAEEAFTVYDHPQVMIFKRQNFDKKKFLKLIGAKK